MESLRPEFEHEKYGVECSCPTGKPDEGHLTKTASGDRKCEVCGRTYPTPGSTQDEPKNDSPKK